MAKSSDSVSLVFIRCVSSREKCSERPSRWTRRKPNSGAKYDLPVAALTSASCACSPSASPPCARGGMVAHETGSRGGSCGGRVGGCHMGVTWVSHGCHMGRHMGCHMGRHMGRHIGCHIDMGYPAGVTWGEGRGATRLCEEGDGGARLKVLEDLVGEGEEHVVKNQVELRLDLGEEELPY
eukprot:3566215-Prymnesium_polylepis.1